MRTRGVKRDSVFCCAALTAALLKNNLQKYNLTVNMLPKWVPVSCSTNMWKVKQWPYWEVTEIYTWRVIFHKDNIFVIYITEINIVCPVLDCVIVLILWLDKADKSMHLPRNHAGYVLDLLIQHGFQKIRDHKSNRKSLH